MNLFTLLACLTSFTLANPIAPVAGAVAVAKGALTVAGHVGTIATAADALKDIKPKNVIAAGKKAVNYVGDKIEDGGKKVVNGAKKMWDKVF